MLGMRVQTTYRMYITVPGMVRMNRDEKQRANENVDLNNLVVLLLSTIASGADDWVLAPTSTYTPFQNKKRDLNMMPSNRPLFCYALLVLCVRNSLVHAEDQKSPEAKPILEDQPKVEDAVPKNTFNAEDHTNWGSYYDPQNIFCGKYDCYKILGFDYESFGNDKPDTKVITKRYRSLSRVWHPDKSKHKDAKERFVVRTRALQSTIAQEKDKIQRV